MEGGSCSNNNNNSSSSCLMMMGFGGGGGGGLQHHSNSTSGGLCSMMIMPPQNVVSDHHNHNNNALFLNNQNQSQNQNRLHNFTSSSCSTMMPQRQDQDHHQHHPNNNNNNLITGSYFMDNNNNNSVDHNNNNNIVDGVSSSVRAKIMAHPHYNRLLAAYVNCQKIGAPPEVVARLEEACAAAGAGGGRAGTGCIGEDPALDQFMEAYCEMLSKYEQELSKPFKEAMLFLSRVECQFKALSLSSPDSAATAGGACGDGMDRNGSSEEEADLNNSFIDPQAEDRELKGQLLRKYSGYLGSLKQEFMKKRKKGKLPKEARQQLLEWWSRHYKWPYPSESQKLALAESTGLDQKQINNWFINQRKRHWKPSEDMQFVVMDAHPHHHYYMENVMGNPYPMDISQTLL